MKVKDYFARLKRQAKLGGEDFDKFIETAPDHDMPDVVSALLEENFLTRERAAADKELMKRMKAEIYDGVDARIGDLISSFPASDRDLIANEKDTYNKIKLLDSTFKKQVEEIKKTSPDADKINQEHVKTIRELTERVETEKGEREKVLKSQDKVIKDITAQKDKELKAYKIRTDIVGKLGQLEFAKEFTDSPTVKNMFFNGIIEDLMKNDLDYDDSGHIVVQEISNGVPKPKYFAGTNDLVTVEKLLETATSPFIKRNNGDVEPRTPTPRSVAPQPQTGQTLAQRRAAAATAD